MTEELEISHAKLVVGFSMGGAQTYQWAVQYPDYMDGIVPICGSARNSIHNGVFLEGVKSAIVAARCGMSAGIGKGQTYPSSEGWTPEQKEAALKAFARVYAGWGLSQAFYRERLFDKHFSCGDAEEFLVKFWEKWASQLDPDNLLVMLQTWQLGDVSALPQFAGDLPAALRSIKAKVLVCPAKTDLYFPPEDSEFEVETMTEGKARLEVIPSIWGHWAGAPGHSEKDEQILDEKIAMFLSDI
jgi:homoserine acetyltransferase